MENRGEDQWTLRWLFLLLLYHMSVVIIDLRDTASLLLCALNCSVWWRPGLFKNVCGDGAAAGRRRSGGGGWCPHCMYTVVTSSVSSSSQGSFRMHLISSIMDSHKEGASLTPDRRGVCLSREGGSGVYREGSEGVPKFKNAVTCRSNCTTTFTTLRKCDCVKCASLPSFILPPLNKSFQWLKTKTCGHFQPQKCFQENVLRSTRRFAPISTTGTWFQV